MRTVAVGTLELFRSHFTVAMQPKQFLDLGKKAVTAWSDDFAPSMGAAISYYTVFSLAPLLVIVIAVAGALFGREAVQGEIVAQLSGFIGRDGALAVQGLVKSASEPSKGLLAGLLSVGVLLVGATTVFAELQSALDRIWHVPAAAKPSGCRRFPYGLLTTPEGGRITTEHRCPCRTLGDRPPLNVLDAERSLSTLSGRIEPDHRVPDRVPVAANRFVSFARYREAEAPMIERLLNGERAEDVLGAKVLPEPHFGSWPGFAGELYELKDHTAGGASICWFADALMFLCEGHVAPKRPRPWADSFERAIARSSERQDPEQIINDWVADELWMMRWLDWDCTFDVARAELATRVAMVRHIIDRMRKQKVRADQAAAEAVMIVEIGAANESWTEVVDSIANSPSPASELFPKMARRASR